MRLTFIIILVLHFHASVAQNLLVTISGQVRHKSDKLLIAYANVLLRTGKDSVFIEGTITNDDGRFTFTKVKPGSYIIEVSYSGLAPQQTPLFVGTLSAFLEIPAIEMESMPTALSAVVITGKADEVVNKLDKKVYSVANNIAQAGGSVLQTMQNLPGVTVEDGKILFRGSNKITVLIDGRQTALTGFGSQSALDNIPASAVEKIEIINNPSSKYDANGSAGIINVIMKKNRQLGWSGKVGVAAGAGSLWIRKGNLPTIRPQYQGTPKINPSFLVNYRRSKTNVFFQGDNLYTHTLNKNEFVTRVYDDGTIIKSQLKRNRNTNFLTVKTGLDWLLDEQNTVTISGLFGSEKIIDRGDQPFFNGDLSDRNRLWQFLEDELKSTAMATASFQHKFKEPGHVLTLGFNYTFHREDEKYFYDNILHSAQGTDAFKLLSDEQVYDFGADYARPLKYGRIEGGIKFRNRLIPTNMQFIPGVNSVLDTSAGGWATYKELIPAVYSNYLFENEKWETELGLRIEYVKIDYNVNPDHRTYKSDGYDYTQPFPNFRIAYKVNANNKLSLFYNRRVDRPNEVDIRIFPKYDDAEIIKVGNPALRPQFTNTIELGYKYGWAGGYLYGAAYHRFVKGTITRISSIVNGSTLVYAIFQNAGKSFNSGIEMILNHKISSSYSVSINGNIYRNQINAFTVENLYPAPHPFTAEKQDAVSGNVKINNTFKVFKNLDAQFSAVYLAPDIIPQGRIKSRFSVDAGIKKVIQHGSGELFFNATDLLNTMVIRKEIAGQGFRYTSDDYYETQVFRLGYSYKF